MDMHPSFLKNIRRFNSFAPEALSVFINDIEIKIHLFEAILKSSKIIKILSQDNTIRSLRINQVFRSNVAQDKIIDFLTSNKLALEDEVE